MYPGSIDCGANYKGCGIDDATDPGIFEDYPDDPLMDDRWYENDPEY